MTARTYSRDKLVKMGEEIIYDNWARHHYDSALQAVYWKCLTAGGVFPIPDYVLDTNVAS